MRTRMTLAFVFILAPFLLISSHLLLTQFRRHHLGPNSDPGWPPFVIFTGASVVFFGVVAWLMIGRTLSPIGALAKQAEEASVDHSGVRLTAPSEDAEMRELVATLNGFLSRMEQAAEEKAHFYGAASHELRTPLQALSGHLEVALSQPRTAEEYAVALREAHEQSQRLTSLVQSILLLHQLQGRDSVPKERVDLKAIVLAGKESMSALAEARRLSVESSFDEPSVIPSVPGHAEILVRNLLENALKYSPEGSTISFKAGSKRLQVENPIEGSDLNSGDLMKPFFRREASRSATGGGNGLGLAICRAICAANGWTMKIDVSDSRLSVSVLLSV